LIYDVACDPQPAPPHLLFQHSRTITTPSSPWFSLLFCFLIGWTKSNTKATTILTKASFSFVDNIKISQVPVPAWDLTNDDGRKFFRRRLPNRFKFYWWINTKVSQ
jgi:hypothetical protein